jgi:hypothetical protein
MPVFPTDVLSSLVTATVNNNAHDDKDNNGDDLEKTEPVLNFTVRPDGNEIDSNEDNPENETQGPAGKVVGPVLENEL